MKLLKYLLHIGLIITLILVMGCDSESSKTQYNPELAKRIGADDYGMKKYTMAFLKKELNRNLSTN